MPTSPGHVPLQLATVSTGLCARRVRAKCAGCIARRIRRRSAARPWNFAEDLDAVFLAVDEAVLFDRIVRMAAHDLAAFLFNRGDEFLFHGRLFGLAFLIRRKAQVAVATR